MYLIFVLCLVSLVGATVHYDFTLEDYNQVKNSRNFTGKVVLVTGSTSGFGEGIVKLFSLLGAHVVITGRNETRIKSVGQEVLDLSPNKLKPLEVIAELTKTEDLNRLLNKTIETFGKLDVLVNNAGIYPSSPIREKNFMQVLDEVWAIDFRSVAQLIHLSVPHLDKTNGTIINISGIGALRAGPNMLALHSSKVALNMLTEVLAIELGPRIRVNTVSPGATESHPLTEERRKSLEKFINGLPLKRVGFPLDIAKSVVFLASNDSEFITGTNLVVDGGCLLT